MYDCKCEISESKQTLILNMFSFIHSSIVMAFYPVRYELQPVIPYSPVPGEGLRPITHLLSPLGLWTCSTLLIHLTRLYQKNCLILFGTVGWQSLSVTVTGMPHHSPGCRHDRAGFILLCLSTESRLHCIVIEICSLEDFLCRNSFVTVLKLS